MSLWSDFVDSFKTEVRETLERPKLWLSALVFPLIWLSVIVSMFATGLMRELPVAYIDMDQTAQSREMLRSLDAVPSIKLQKFDTSEEALEQMRAGRVFASIKIPERWSAKTLAGDNTSAIELLFAKSYFAIATTLEIDIKSTLAAKSMEALGKQAIGPGGGIKGAKIVLSAVKPDAYIIGNSAFSYAPYFYSVLLPCVFAVTVMLTMVGVFIREWREQRWRERCRDGASVHAIFFGKAAPWILVFSLYACAYVSWFAGYMGFTPAGSVFLWTFGAILMVCSMVAIASMLVAISPFLILSMSLGICCTAPILPFTGFSYPFDCMDPIAIGLGHGLPLTWFFRIQLSQWMLASPLSHTLYLIAMLSLFIIVPTVVTAALLPMRMRKWIENESHPKPEPELREVKGAWAEIFEGPRRGICALDTVAVFLCAMAMYLAFYAWPYVHQTVTGVEVALVDLDMSPTSRSLASRIDSTSALRVVLSDTDMESAIDAFKREKVAAIIQIPENYERDLLAGKPTHLPAIINGFYAVKGRVVQATLMSLSIVETKKAAARNLSRAGVDSVRIKRLSVLPVSMAERNLFNSISGYATYIVPLVTPVILQAVMLMSVGFTFGGWLESTKRDRYCERLLTSRATFVRCILGFVLFAFIWVCYAEGLDFAMFGFPSMKNFLGSMLLMVLLCFSIICLGFLSSLLIGTNAYVAQFLVITSAPAVFLSGAIYPTSGFGPLARIVAPFFPATPGIQGMLAMSQNGASTASLFPQFALLAVQAVFYFLLADYMRKREARKRGLLPAL